MDATIVKMGKNPPQTPGDQEPSSKDRHYSKFMIRLPEEYRVALRELQKKILKETGYRISLTDLVRRAIDHDLRQHEIEPPVCELED